MLSKAANSAIWQCLAGLMLLESSSLTFPENDMLFPCLSVCFYYGIFLDIPVLNADAVIFLFFYIMVQDVS